MLQAISFPEELIQETGKSPAVCLVLPFEPQIKEKSLIQSRLQAMLEKAENRLLQQYSYRKSLPVLARLRQLISEISYYQYKKSLAILATPYLSRIFYLDFPVTETVRTGEDLDIRNIVKARNNQPNYLALVINKECVDVYEGGPATLTLMKHNTRSHSKWHHEADTGLHQLLQAYPLPVIVIGSAPDLETFRKATMHGEQILAFVPGDSDLTQKEVLLNSLQSALKHWHQHQQEYVLQKLQKAQQDNVLDYGIDRVWEAATHRRSALLAVEENFIHLVPRVNTIHQPEEPQAWPIVDPLQHLDLVNDTIEKVLKDGGEVVLLPAGMLSSFQHIALIEASRRPSPRKNQAY